MSRPAQPVNQWVKFRADTAAALTPAETESILRHPLALEPGPVLELLRSATRPAQLAQPEHEAVEHLHANLCGSSNSAINIRTEHAAVGLILAELATLFPTRYIFSTGDGLALALASFVCRQTAPWDRVTAGIADLAELDQGEYSAAAIVAATQTIDWIRKGGGKDAQPVPDAIDLSGSGMTLWSFAIASGSRPG